VARNEGNSADLDSLGSREERHSQRVTLDRRDDVAPIDENTRDARLLGGHADGQATRPGADDYQVGGFSPDVFGH
jgi:hypothetical protein